MGWGPPPARAGGGKGNAAAAPAGLALRRAAPLAPTLPLATERRSRADGPPPRQAGAVRLTCGGCPPGRSPSQRLALPPSGCNARRGPGWACRGRGRCRRPPAAVSSPRGPAARRAGPGAWGG